MTETSLELTKQYENNQISYSNYVSKLKELYAIEQLEKNDKLNKFKTQTNELTCSVCMFDDNSAIQTECGHYVHLECLKKCHKYTNDLFFKCPTCRHELSDIHPEFNLDDVNYIFYKKSENMLKIIVVDYFGIQWNCPQNINTPFITNIINSGKLYTPSYDKKTGSFCHNPSFKRNLLSDFNRVAN